jgi:hypothetical protein
MPEAMGGWKGSIKKEAVVSLVAEIGVAAGILGTAYAMGYSIEMNPESSDMWKIVDRKTGRRYDFLNGYQQPVRMAMLGVMTLYNLASGKKDVAQKDFVELITGYLKYKMAPAWSTLYSFTYGHNIVYERRTKTETALRAGTPITVETILDEGVADFVPLDNAIREWYTLPPPDREPAYHKIMSIIGEMTGAWQSSKYHKKSKSTKRRRRHIP